MLQSFCWTLESFLSSFIEKNPKLCEKSNSELYLLPNLVIPNASKGQVRVIKLLVILSHWFSISYFDYSAFAQAISFSKTL